MGKYAAIIAAAGYASRMGFLKPLLPVSPNELVIERVIRVFQRAGIHDIRVILGHQAHLLKPLVEKMEAMAVVNEVYSRGMYTSVQVGVDTLKTEIDAFFFLPADMPFVSSEVITEILNTFETKSCDVVYPVYKDQKGHPPLISTALQPLILKREAAGGLQALLRAHARTEQVVAVHDKGVLMDIDTEAAYRSAVRNNLADFPTAVECHGMWLEHGTEAHIVSHMQQVERVARALGEHLNSQGYHLHLGLISAACLLHDLVRGNKNHAVKGASLIADKGYPEVAHIVAVHMDLPIEFKNQISETTLVYLADKLVADAQLTDLSNRMEKILVQFQGNDQAQKSAEKRLTDAMDLQKMVEAALKCPLMPFLHSELVQGVQP